MGAAFMLAAVHQSVPLTATLMYFPRELGVVE